MKKYIVLALAVISLCSMAAVTLTTNGPKPSKEHDVFAARYVPEYGHTIEEVYFHGDLQPFARINRGTYWVFLFDAVFDGKFHGTEARIQNVGYSSYRLCPYWPRQCLSSAGPWAGEVAGLTGFVAHPVDGSGPTCFGWKSLDIVTNYCPVIGRKSGAPLVFGDLTLAADDVPKDSMVCYGIVQTNINVRLDAKWN